MQKTLTNAMLKKELKKNLKNLFELIYVIIKNNYVHSNIWIYYVLSKQNIISLNKKNECNKT
jgi:hypothetical protein